MIPAATMRKLFTSCKNSSLRLFRTKYSSLSTNRPHLFLRKYSSTSKFDFNSVSETSLNNLLERLESKEPFLPSTFDVEYSQGVLTIKFNSETVYVLNKQPPNQQIWLSSPFSGPRRFEWNSELDSWRDVRNSEIELIKFLQNEFSQNLKIDF